MKLKVIFFSGPTSGGKSTLIRMLATEVCERPPHYLRLVPVEGKPRLTLLGDLKEAGLATWKRINYDADRIFEFLPECLNEIATHDGPQTVFIEADVDPSLRFAYPYDHRVYIMPAPCEVSEVFRTPAEAAAALKEVMDDTAAFASEIFGMFDPDPDDTASFSVSEAGAGYEERVEITPTQMRRFMVSPLGAEIASRIQLQPDYHGLLESDAVVVNTGVGGTSELVDRCINQLQTLCDRLAEGRPAQPTLFACDLTDREDPMQIQLVENLRNHL